MSQYNYGGQSSHEAAARKVHNTHNDYTDTCSQIARLEATLEKTLKAYEQVLWLYAEGICRCSPERLEYLMSVQFPFHLRPDVLVDLEVLVRHILEGNDVAVSL